MAKVRQLPLGVTMHFNVSFSIRVDASRVGLCAIIRSQVLTINCGIVLKAVAFSGRLGEAVLARCVREAYIPALEIIINIVRSELHRHLRRSGSEVGRSSPNGIEVTSILCVLIASENFLDIVLPL